MEVELAKRHGGNRTSSAKNFTLDQGRTADIVAAKLGFGSGKTYEAAKAGSRQCMRVAVAKAEPLPPLADHSGNNQPNCSNNPAGAELVVLSATTRQPSVVMREVV
jgi:hypothetical protein